MTPFGFPVVPEVNWVHMQKGEFYGNTKHITMHCKTEFGKKQYFWNPLNLDVAGVVHPDLVRQLGHHLGRGRACAAHHILEPENCHQHNLTEPNWSVF